MIATHADQRETGGIESDDVVRRRRRGRAGTGSSGEWARRYRKRAGGGSGERWDEHGLDGRAGHGWAFVVSRGDWVAGGGAGAQQIRNGL